MKATAPEKDEKKKNGDKASPFTVMYAMSFAYNIVQVSRLRLANMDSQPSTKTPRLRSHLTTKAQVCRNL